MVKNKDQNKEAERTGEIGKVQETKAAKEIRAAKKASVQNAVEVVEVEVEVSKKNVSKTNFSVNYSRPPMWLFSFLMIFLMLDLILAFSTMPEGCAAVFDSAAVLASILVSACFVFILWGQATTKWNMRNDFSNPCKMLVSGKYVAMKKENIALRCRVNFFNRVGELEHDFFFAVNRKDGFVIPRYLLSADEEQSVWTMIEKHVNVKDWICGKMNSCSHSTMNFFMAVSLRDGRGAYIVT